MTARKGDIRAHKATKITQGYRRPYKATEGHTRSHMAIQYHNVSQKITLCPN